MKTINPFEEDVRPPFDGFPEDALRFFRQLKRNNNREWFERNKPRYLESVRAPMESLLAGLGQKIRSFDANIPVEPKKAIYRIYRDIRFSKDKTPYKTQIAASFSYRGKERKTDAGFYFHLNDTAVGIGGGMYMPDADQLKSVRKAIALDAKPLIAALSGKKFIRLFGGLQGDMLARVPKGYPPDHPAAELLKRRQFLCWAEFEPSVALEAGFADLLFDHVKAMAPFVHYLAANT
jgi:uncharacterized protein (TIGR02453 family)